MEFVKNQKLFIEEVFNGKNVFLTGKAGTGKSFVVNWLIEQLKNQGKTVAALAPTGIAANNVNGQTLHSFFQLPVDGVATFESCRYLKSEKKRMIKLIDVIFIDEVSMLRADLMDAINWTLIKNGCKKLSEIQLVLVGDMKQLKPVADDNMKAMITREYDGVEFYNAMCYKNLNILSVELDEVLRQSDPEFIEALNVVRDGGKSPYFKRFVKSEISGTVLAPHNATVNKYNLQGLNSVDGHEYNFKAIVDGNVKAHDFNMESEIRVKHGCKIMYLINSKNNNLVNGTIGTFAVKEDRFFIDVDGILYPLEINCVTKKEYVLNEAQTDLELQEIGSISQYPIKLAYALSIHKSQGLTFDEITVDLTLPCFAEGQMYVALSRVRTPKGLTILTK